MSDVCVSGGLVVNGSGQLELSPYSAVRVEDTHRVGTSSARTIKQETYLPGVKLVSFSRHYHNTSGMDLDYVFLFSRWAVGMTTGQPNRT